MLAVRLAACLVLLAGSWWVSAAFVPSVFTRSGSRSTARNAAVLRGAPGARAPLKDSIGIMVLAPIGMALSSLAFRKRQQRIPTLVRHAAKTYKDYEDPWLGSADFGFDPLNAGAGTMFDSGTAVVPETTYYNYRESEVKHGRFAMIAFLAIFFEEADRSALLHQLGIAGATDRLDATLGLDEVQPPVLALGLGAQALAEYNKQSSEDDDSFWSVEYEKERCPGDLSFDPLGFRTGQTRQQLIELHNAEVNLGRLAMIGITSFVYKEFLSKIGNLWYCGDLVCATT